MSIVLYSDSLLSQHILSIRGDVVTLSSDSVLVFSAQVKSIYQQACLTIKLQMRYLTSVNDVLPDLSGTLLMLGSECISIVDCTDTSDPRSTPAEHTINIFDGCAACNDCDSVWLVSQLVKECHIWAIGLKDCLLYYLPAAAQLWNRLFSDRNIIDHDQQKYVVDWSGNCSYRAQLLPQDRQDRLNSATKLLYQYKAMVAMWNYLVYNISSRMRVLTTALDYTGISIKLKRRFNLCNCDALIITLHITAKRTGQDTYGYAVQKANKTTLISITPTLLSVLSVIQDISESAESIPYGLAFYILPTALNTYILRYTDRGGKLGDIYVTRYNPSSNIINTLTTVSYTKSLSTISVDIAFTVGAFNGLLTCSALLKIIPVFIANIMTPKITKLSLSLYAQHAHKNTTYNKALLTNTNRWYILTLWLCLGLPRLDDATYFTTAYNLYPTKFLLLLSDSSNSFNNNSFTLI